jgi:hypothetical protein
MLLVCIRSCLKSILRYEFLFLGAYHPDTLDLRERGYEDIVVNCRSRKGSQTKKVSETPFWSVLSTWYNITRWSKVRKSVYNRGVDSKVRITDQVNKPGTPPWNTDLEHRPSTQTRKTTLEHRPATQTFNTDQEHNPGTRIWNKGLEHRPGTQTWNTDLEHRPGTQTWNTDLEYSPITLVPLSCRVCLLTC